MYRAQSLAIAAPSSPITGIRGCCARTATGQAVAAPVIPTMNSRRRIAFTKAGLRRIGRDYSRDLPPAEWGSRISLHGSNPKTVMSALGQKRTLEHVRVMSALPPKADIETRSRSEIIIWIG